MKTLLLVLMTLPAWCTSASAQVENPFDNVLGRSQQMQPAAEDNRVTALLKQNFTAAHKEMRYRYNYWQQDIGGIDALLQSADRLHAICLQLTPAKKRQLLEQKLAFVKELELRCAKDVTRTNSAALREINEASVAARRLAIELEIEQLAIAVAGTSKNVKTSR